jgi:septal ring-binding cell division protein DamX
MQHQQLQGKTYLYQDARSRDDSYVILLGTFNTYKMAKLASKELKKNFPEIDPWIKDYKTIHSNIR